MLLHKFYLETKTTLSTFLFPTNKKGSDRNGRLKENFSMRNGKKFKLFREARRARGECETSASQAHSNIGHIRGVKAVFVDL